MEGLKFACSTTALQLRHLPPNKKHSNANKTLMDTAICVQSWVKSLSLRVTPFQVLGVMCSTGLKWCAHRCT